MGPRRFVDPPEPQLSPRTSLDSDTHSRIDSILKQLRTCTRHLQSVLSLHRTEIQILERLYYKGKNQHRTALFWQRVVEMRRYGDRIDGMGMHDLLENLRLSFWGQPSQRTWVVSTGLRDSIHDMLSCAVLKCWRGLGHITLMQNLWASFLKDVPPVICSCARYVERGTARGTRLNTSAGSRTLVRSVSVRISFFLWNLFWGRESSFTLMMQTGAFLQLIVTLVAIASRMSTLLAEVRDSMQHLWSASFELLQILDASTTCLLEQCISMSYC